MRHRPCLVGGGEPEMAGADHSPVSTRLQDGQDEREEGLGGGG